MTLATLVTLYPETLYWLICIEPKTFPQLFPAAVTPYTLQERLNIMNKTECSPHTVPRPD